MLSSGDAWAHLDMERQDQRSPSHRYYRHVLSRTIDGRVFELGLLDISCQVVDILERSHGMWGEAGSNLE